MDGNGKICLLFGYTYFYCEIVNYQIKQFLLLISNQVDARNDGVNTPELYLKFWHLDPISQNYQQSCRIDYPHSETVLSLCFHNGTDDDDPIFISTGLDTKFKVWQLKKKNDDDSMEAGKYPVCLYYLFYWPLNF